MQIETVASLALPVVFYKIAVFAMVAEKGPSLPYLLLLLRLSLHSGFLFSRDASVPTFRVFLHAASVEIRIFNSWELAGTGTGQENRPHVPELAGTGTGQENRPRVPVPVSRNGTGEPSPCPDPCPEHIDRRETIC